MPLARRPTPPPEDVRTQLTVLESLNAWTANDEHDDESKPRKVPLGYTPLCQNEQGPQKGWMGYCLDSESDFFNSFIGVVIICNAIFIGLETDYGEAHFEYWEYGFNAIFILEMFIRIFKLKLEYFKDPWYLFDFTLVVSGSLDLWIIPLIIGEEGKRVGYELMVLRLLRILRLCRVLRVIRLFRMFNHLLLIVKAFGKALQVVLLISILIVIIIYSFAIVLTQLIGHNADKWPDENQEDILKWFGTVTASMTTLFWVMFGSGWDPLLNLLSHEYPKGMILGAFASYMVLTVSLASMIVGLISQSLIIAQEEFKERKIASFASKKKVLASEIANEIVEMHEEDIDQATNTIEAESLKTMIRANTDLMGKLATVGVALTTEGLASLVDSLSNWGEEPISIEHFVEKLINLSGQSQASSVVDVKYELMKNKQRMEELDSLLDKIDAKMGK